MLIFLGQKFFCDFCQEYGHPALASQVRLSMDTNC